MFLAYDLGELHDAKIEFQRFQMFKKFQGLQQRLKPLKHWNL